MTTYPNKHKTPRKQSPWDFWTKRYRSPTKTTENARTGRRKIQVKPEGNLETLKTWRKMPKTSFRPTWKWSKTPSTNQKRKKANKMTESNQKTHILKENSHYTRHGVQRRRKKHTSWERKQKDDSQPNRSSQPSQPGQPSRLSRPRQPGQSSQSSQPSQSSHPVSPVT